MHLTYPVSRARHRRQAFWLAVAALLVLGAGLGLRDPWPADEPRFALVAQQMVESGQWLVPMRGVELYSDKPPMFLWLQGVVQVLTGAPRLAFLLPSLLAALGTLWLVYDLGRRLWRPRVGLWAAGMLLLSVHFVYQAKKAQIDPTLVFFVTLSAYGLLRHLLCGPQWRWWFIGWFAAGIGMITKGVGFLPLFLLLPYLAARWHGGFRLPPIPARDWRWYVLPLGLPLAAGLWVGPVLYEVAFGGDPALRAYAQDIFLRQTAGRFVNPWDHRGKGALYFVWIVLAMWMPLSLALPWLLPAWWRRIRRRLDARFLLPVAWVAMVIAFFSLSPGKRDVYILPALPMMALAAAPLMAAISRRAAYRWMVFAVAAAIALGLFAGGLAAVLGEPGFEARQEAARGLGDGDSAWWMLAVVGALGVAGAAIARPRRALAAWAATFGAVWVLAFGFWGYPLLNEANSARGVMARARAAAGPETTIALVAWKEQNLLMLEGPHHDFGFSRRWGEQRRDALAWLAADPERRRVFILERALGACIDRARLLPLGVANRRTWYLFGADALVPGCVDDGTSDERLRPDRSLRPAGADDDDDDADAGG